jgi:heat-inducible transcriptional repressor
MLTELLDITKDKVIIDNVSTNSDSEIVIKIGGENMTEYAKDCSVVSAIYSIDNKPLGTIGIIGPTRMEYSKVIPVVGEFIKLLNQNISNIYKDDR